MNTHKQALYNALKPLSRGYNRVGFNGRRGLTAWLTERAVGQSGLDIAHYTLLLVPRSRGPRKDLCFGNRSSRT